MIRKFLAFIVISLFCLVAVPVSSAAELKENGLLLKLNGAYLIFSKGTMPYIDSNFRTLIPLRIVSDSLNGTINWDNANKIVSLNSSVLSFKAKVNENKVELNGKIVSTDTSIVTKNGTVMVPAKWIAEGLNIQLSWDPKNKVVSMNHPDFFAKGPLERMSNEQNADQTFDPQIIPKKIYYEEKKGESVFLKVRIYNASNKTYSQLQDHLLVIIDKNNFIEEGLKGETFTDRSDLALIEKIEPGKSYDYFLPVTNLNSKQLQVGYPEYAFIRYYDKKN
ncbi:copper amine oxidase N-terminal domain-containing protein [Paenibacillus caui]|uniref:copper amine oxidase N-terminal domain-containing protein n=1 Tax=Paenibacillus caui TaxID=2873927 RepID=UPI001CA9DB4E|nr:copper amine oxidase N-terminal domain-containing protein [Paenibacillus caui]